MKDPRQVTSLPAGRQGHTPHVIGKKPVLFVVGPTAAGKTEIALTLAARLDAEIISCDALQVYTEIQIASDKPSLPLRRKIKHHCLNVVSMAEDFDVARFRKIALEALAEIRSRGKLPLIVGGSGMYMAVLLDGIFEEDVKDEGLREQLQKDARETGALALHERLKALDPKAAAKIHPNDPKRVVRALEIVLSTGQPISQWQRKRAGLWGQEDVRIFALSRPREELYKRAEARVDEMFARGLVEEIAALKGLSLSRTARTMIGVPEVMGYLNGEYGLEQAKYLMKLNTRHFIKRQMTWFRKDKRLQWIEIEAGQDAASVVEQIVLCINGE